MGFCRRCGDIVPGARCQCGGTSVAPVISWKYSSSSISNQDRWSKTYVSDSVGSASPAIEREQKPTKASLPTSNDPARRFPRPLSANPLKPFKHGVSDHITLVTSQSPRPPSPLKMSTTFSGDTENDILPSFLPHEPTLSKVYGSLLQPKDTLTLHSCACCSVIFPPDATIYPDPSPSNPNSFLCRPCFTISGGSKGSCPSCARPVLALKEEGGYIHSGGKYWHNRCYNCAGCFKNIGDTPMVDLLGRPSCVECFDNCLKRDPSTPKKDRTSNNNSPNISNPGGLNANYGKKSRENSPAIEELEQRLGLAKSRESSPAAVDVSRNLLKLDTSSHRHPSYSSSPQSKQQDVFGGTSPTNLHNSPIQRRLSSVNAAPPSKSLNSFGLGGSQTSNSPTRAGKSKSSPIEELSGLATSNITSKAKLGSPADSASSGSPGMSKSYNSHNSSISQAVATSFPGLPVTTMSICGRCARPILNPREGGQFISVPGADENAVPQVYHPECFKCAVCDKSLSDIKRGQLSFLKSDAGPCHTQCAPAELLVIRRSVGTKLHGSNSMAPPQFSFLSLKQPIEMPAPSTSSQRLITSPLYPSKAVFPRFGGQNACPGCQKSVSLMERGVVPGPQGTRWHASCLVCGGKKEPTRAVLLGRGREEKKKGEPGCGKKLDSAAKSDGEGGVWCRECLLLRGVGGSPQTSPARSPLHSFTSSPTKIAPQFTGSTTIARQFTGLGGSDTILRQLTGGGLSPTRSISPTKQLGMMGTGGGVARPRPKSVIGMRSTKSVDEGRGMYLVRQFTGATMNG
ncbi:hypothetical protein GALMADRAFT_324195 [Galerina marginata CBS 339.88]|uniref:LIM zinc-binding domain-containing protein n=1 Tax=Galerina marginata (strain CBS 339.88) TaxID=685588 RepID=A0A067TYQ3_GALM3|nr:hypothetical protein GALMADRAFT_324195 [Galerina marginata CBS 339.88]